MNILKKSINIYNWIWFINIHRTFSNIYRSFLNIKKPLRNILNLLVPLKNLLKIGSYFTNLREWSVAKKTNPMTYHFLMSSCWEHCIDGNGNFLWKLNLVILTLIFLILSQNCYITTEACFHHGRTEFYALSVSLKIIPLFKERNQFWRFNEMFIT